MAQRTTVRRIVRGASAVPVSRRSVPAKPARPASWRRINALSNRLGKINRAITVNHIFEIREKLYDAKGLTRDERDFLLDACSKKLRQLQKKR